MSAEVTAVHDALAPLSDEPALAAYGYLSLAFNHVGSPDRLVCGSSGDSETAVLHASRC